RYPELAITPVCADYTHPFALPESETPADRTVAFFPGSTIGNFEPEGAIRFLRTVAALVGSGGGLLIGVDLKKDSRILHAAYNDPQGVTAQFNRNLLVRINHELDGTFVVERFRHKAFYDGLHGRIEMQLVSTEKEPVFVAGRRFSFDREEPITTE